MRAYFLRLSFAVILFPGLFSVSAQAPATSAPSTFSAEPFVIQLISVVNSFKADGTGYREQTGVVKMQADSAVRELGVLRIPFASQSQHVEIHYARVRHADGSVIETPVTDAIEEPAPVTREAPFYSDLKQKELPIKNLHVGDTLEWQVRIIRTVPEAPAQFWGQENYSDNAVVLDHQFELRFPAAVHVTVWTNPKDGAAPKEATEGSEHVYRWSHSNLKPTVGPEAEAAKKAQEKHIFTADEETDITDGKMPSLAWTTFPDWPSVGAWYRKLEGTRTVPDDAIKAKVAELTAGKSTEEEKARAIYDYVSTQIRYIGVAFGIGRYQPHLAPDVLSNQYGDCKDKHTLLASMLSAAGISSDAVLIGAGIRFNDAVPSPEAFNHLITRAHIGNQDTWLDTTAEVAPWRVLNPVLRDKSGLLVPDAAPAAIAHTPKDLPFVANESWTSVGSLDSTGTSESRISLTLHDDTEVELRSAIHQISAAQYPEAIQNITRTLGYAGTSTKPDFSRPDDLSKPFTFSFDYHREKSGDWDNLRIIAQLYPVEIPYLDETKPPTSTVLLGYPRTVTSSAQMKLPAGWGVELPEATHAKSSFATFDETYRFQDGTLYSERKLVVLRPRLPVSEWPEYKKFQKDAGLGQETFIQLIRHTGASSTGASSPGAAATPPVTTYNAQAAKLVDEARESIGKGDTDHALTVLNQAKGINPQQRDLWGTYGYRAYDLGMTSEAIEDYTKELTFHPDSTWVYGPLSHEYYVSGNHEQSIATLRQWIASEPKNPDPPSMLIGVLASSNDNQAAVKIGTEALKNVEPDNPKIGELQLALANVQVATNAMTDAAANLVAVLKVTTDSLIKNNAAYLLSEAGLNLPEAEAAERSVLDNLTAETRAWTLDEAPDTLKKQTSLLCASWDTMGWILFREGHIKDARVLVEAAWRNQQHAEVGLHLGDIALADNDPNAALKAYELANATLPHLSGGKVPPARQAESDKIQAGIARAKKAGAKSQLKDPRAALQAMRTVDLGPADGRSGSVEYRILIAQGKAELARPMDHDFPRANSLIRSASFAGFTPANSEARIAHFGYLNCVSASCEFVIEP